MRDLLIILLVEEVLAQVCLESMKGDGQCDRVCMTAVSAYDTSSSNGVSDCWDLCLTHCAAVDIGSCKTECLTWDCVGAGGVCGECAAGCQATKLGNGQCEPQCNVEECSFDAGDCASDSSPNEIYISTNTANSGDGRWSDPANNLAKALVGLWLPFNSVYLLAGTHLLHPWAFESTLLAKQVLNRTTISTLFCRLDSTDHKECASTRAVIQLTAQFTAFTILHTVVFDSVIFQGEFPLKVNCNLPTCLYCPYIALDTAYYVYRNDRGQEVNLADYATQSLCDFYHQKSFIVVTITGKLTLSNSLFTAFRQQLKALIWNECGDIQLFKVSFDRCIPAPQGLKGGLLGQTCPDNKAPYYCGHVSYIGGSVSRLNEGYEYRADISTSGFLSADGLNALLVEDVTFEHNFLPIGALATTVDSSMLKLERFRTAALKNCIFRYNVASLSVGLTVINSFQFPIILDSNNVATEHQLHHIALSGLLFYNNTAKAGTLLYVQFRNNHQNILINDCRFINNFSTKGALMHMQNDQLLARYQNGAYIEMRIEQVLTDVWIAPRYFNLTSCVFTANYATAVAYLAEFGNVVITDVQVEQTGEDLNQYTAKQYVLQPLIALPGAYLSTVSLAFPTDFTCKSGLVIESVMQIIIDNVKMQNGYCSQGSPGIALIGSPVILLFQDLFFANNIGAGLLTITLSSAIHLSSLVFLNNANDNNSQPVCLNIAFTHPSDLTITNSRFAGNGGDVGAVGTVSYAKSVLISGLLVENNKVKYSGAGLLFNPTPTEYSTLSVKTCIFKGNSADTKGVLTIFDFSGILSDNFMSLVTLTIEDCEFSENDSTSHGAVITIHDFIQLSPSSKISNCKFLHNTSDSGASLYLSYQTGLLTVLSSTFDSNTAPNGGAGVYSAQGPDSQEHPTSVLVTSCVFRYNKGSAIEVSGFSQQNLLISNANEFEGNYDSAVRVRTARFVDSGSVYRNNSAEYGGAMYMKVSSAVVVKNSIFEGNVARVFGGAIYSRFHSPAEFLNCTFHSNSGKSGGVLYSDTTLYIKFDHCQVIDNWALESGSAFYSFSGSVSFTSSVITRNKAYQHSLFVSIKTQIEISNCTVSSNEAADRTAGLSMVSSQLVINDSLIFNQTSKNGGFILGLNNNDITINNSSFVLCSASNDGGAMYVTLESKLVISSSRFYNCSSALLGGAIYATKSSSVVTEVEFVNVTARLGSAMEIADGTGWIGGCRFENYTGSALYVKNADMIVIADSNFSRGVGKAYRGAGVYAVNVAQVNVTNCSFANNDANKGGGLYAFSNTQGDACDNYWVIGNRFENNRAPSGGALESDGVNLVLANNTFVNNSAYSVSGVLLDNGVGGGLVLHCNNPVKCDIIVANNHFRHNSADIDGGAVHWQEAPPVFLNNRFEDNTAQYGDNIASYPIALAPISSSLELISYEDNSTDIPVAFTLNHFASGQLYMNILRFGLFDHLWQLATTANNSIIEIQVPVNTTLSGQSKSSSRAGVFELSGFAITAEPGSSRVVHFVTDGVDASIKSLYNDSARYVDTIAVRINFRLCESGETIRNGACVVCETETYSLRPEQPCKTCLSTAICYGGFLIVPKAGYWRARNDTDTFFECFNGDACVGSPEALPVSLTGLCAEGYSGNLCQVCQTHYSRTGRNNCARCPGKTANILVSSLIILIALSGIALIVLLAIRGATKPRSLMAIYFKIFLNYLQMVVVAASLNLNWPDFVKTFLSTQEMAGGVADQLFSFECLMQDFAYVNHIGTFASKLLIGALLPAAVMLIGMLVWGFIRIIKEVSMLWEKVVASCVVILFIVHPSITKIMFSVYSCMEILPGEYWVIADLAERCWISPHYKAVFFISVPSLAIWVLGLPTLVLVLLVRMRLQLHNMSRRVMFSFLYKGYEPKWFFWEFVILYRKIGLVGAAVFLAPVSVRVESLTILALLLVAIYLQLRYQPYNEATLNKLEVKSILVSAVTIYAGLYYDTRSMNNVINMLLFVFIIIANAYFLATWLVYISPIILATLREKWTFFAKLNKQYRVRPAQSATMAVKDSDKLDHSSSGMVSSSPNESSYPPFESISPPANTPTPLEADQEDL